MNILMTAIQLFVLSSLSVVQITFAQSSLELVLKAAEGGDTRAVAGYLDQGLDPNTTDANGYTMLMIAARQGDLVSVLLSRKANLARQTAVGDTALMMAALGGHTEIVRQLLDAGAQLNGSGWTALHYAAFSGYPDIVALLLRRGADKNAVAPNGYTPLMLASRNGNVAAARALLYEDPDLGHQAPSGETALSLAMKRGERQLEELLRRAGAVR
jgi:uncharacterized protein